jgi:oxygen-dependent protoporphyrinogen oxidase
VGTQTLTDLLLARLTSAGATVHLRTEGTSIRRTGMGYEVHTPLGPIAADHIVLATPAGPAARLLDPIAPDAARGLADLEYASVAMITLAVPRAAVGVPLDASGFLVSEADRLPVLTACSWASRKWAHLADPDVAILRASAGRHGDGSSLELSDDELADAIVADLRTTIGLDGAPVDRRVSRWRDALPQFRPGHLSRVREWREEVATRAPGIVLAGAAYDGLGIPACVRQGRRAADEVAANPTR